MQLGGFRPWVVAVYAAAVVSVPFVASLTGQRLADPVAIQEQSEDGDGQAVAADPLVGLWAAFPPGAEGEEVGFYYFHGDGHGLYRYGRVGLTNTNSFDYQLHGDTLILRMRKSGAVFHAKVQIVKEGDDQILVFADDPRSGPGRYVRERTDPVTAAGQGSIAGRMWIDHTSFATGGYGFTMYQLREAGIDGRGTGWFHRGDYDDWSTESLVYRMIGSRLEIQFPFASKLETTSFEIVPGEQRTLRLDHDPRDFWHAHAYVDGGASFGSAVAAAVTTERVAEPTWVAQTAVLERD